MSGSADQRARGPILAGFYDQLLRRGVQYFLPASHLAIVGGRVPRPTREIVFHPASPGEMHFDSLGIRYVLKNDREFTDHERRMVRSILKFLSTRYEVLFERETTAPNFPIFSGLIEDHYVSTFLSGKVFDDGRSGVTPPDRVSEAIEVLRISALSSYEDKRISTGALLFGMQPDACHPLPPRPLDTLPYSSELTSIRSFH